MQFIITICMYTTIAILEEYNNYIFMLVLYIHCIYILYSGLKIELAVISLVCSTRMLVYGKLTGNRNFRNYFICQKSLGRHPRHSAIDDLIKRSLGSAKISAHLEPVGICSSDGKRPDGATVLPWRSGRILVWDATCPDTFAPSHRDLVTRGAGAVADQAEERNKAKYAELATTHHFVPLAVETTVLMIFLELGRRIKDESGEPLAYQYLLQRISVAVQRGNAAAELRTSSPTDFDFIYSQ